MKTTYIFPAALGIVFLILVGAYVYQNKPAAPASPATESTAQMQTNEQPGTVQTTGSAVVTPTPTPAPTPTPTPAPTGFTRASVATHASKASCWTIVNGSVYDVIAWIGQHPGGAGAILSMCGKDATAQFEGQHGGQGRPEAELASFKIGAVAQ